MSDSMASISAACALASLLCSAAVALYTVKLSKTTDDMRDAAKAQARVAQATTLIQLGPVIGTRIERFVDQHRAALEKLHRLIVDDISLTSALLTAHAATPVTAASFEFVRVHAVDVCEIIPNCADGSTRGPKAFTISLNAKPADPKMHEIFKLRDGFEADDFVLPRWGARETYVLDEQFMRAVYNALWPAIDDANEISSNAHYYNAGDLLREYISRDWRVALVFRLAETGYRSPVQVARYKLEGRSIVVRGSDGHFVVQNVLDADDIVQLDFRNYSPFGKDAAEAV